MAIVSFEELFPEVLATAPTCPAPTIVRAVRNATRELCERTKCYRYRFDAESVSANDPEVILVLPAFTVLAAPITLALNGELLTPSAPSLLEVDAPDWATHTGEPYHYLRSTEELNSIRLYPIPAKSYSTEQGLRGEVALKPSRAAVGIEEMILDQYQTAMVSGTLAKLLMIPSAPWYSPSQASYHAQVFEAEIHNATSRGAADDLPKRRSVRYGGL